MRREQLGGTAMIAATIMGFITMGLHPTGHDIARSPIVQGTLNFGVHSLAILAAPLAFYGGFVLTRRLASGSPLAELALAFYGASAVATMMAATASGFLAPGLIQAVQGSDASASSAAAAVLRYNSSFNQAFAKMIVGGSSIAIGLWSLVIMRTRLMRRGTGILGCLIAIVALLLLLSGRLRLDIHGFGAVVIVQGVWLMMIGFELRKSDPSVHAPLEGMPPQPI
jgi:hypothetical protein